MSNKRQFRIHDGRLTNDSGSVGIFQGFPSGRDRIQFPAWFDQRGGPLKYITCSFIRFIINYKDARYLVWPYSPDAMVQAHYDYNLQRVVIDKAKSVKHLAWYCGDRKTLLKTWETSKVPGVKPRMRVWAQVCPNDLDLARCRSIPELPRLSTFEEPAVKSTEMFDVCVDINALPIL